MAAEQLAHVGRARIINRDHAFSHGGSLRGWPGHSEPQPKARPMR